ncbi:MAG TPA: tRNA (adenosine(37)-N6)-threonylcarbamoyltransferase complex dimerization subunit type 1 TsaB [Pyrinomonadaceae bacterium]|nr:tRNA (adenosine(37)-N6)-threonylcarbamoyltransferase complex dimerization subunit type 1 TsaB [Pyrinomonadaceae bacterium]
MIIVSANQNPLILSIETATRAGSIVVTRGETQLAARTGAASVSHSSHLLQHVESALEEAGAALHDVDFFAAAVGPGSFTGLRIGLATVKAFAATLGRQCVGVQTLHAVARGAGESDRTLALLPAGRGEVYAQLLAVSGDGDVRPLAAPANLSPRKLLEKFGKEPILKWAGEGASLHAEAIKEQAQAEGVSFVEGVPNDEPEKSLERRWVLATSSEILAADVAGLALLRIRAGEAVAPQQLQAVYVRPSDAELNEQWQERKH